MTPTTTTLAPADFEFVCDLVHRHAAIALGPDKQYLVHARLQPIAKREGLGDVAALIARLRRGSADLLDTVIEALTTNETSWFRDGSPFESLANEVLPELIERRRDAKRLDIWSAAVSTGQEAYSIAIILREQFPELASWRLSILATDYNRNVLARARDGRYSPLEMNRGMTPERQERWFEVDGGGWRLREDVRRMVDFRRLNLAQPWAIPKMDIVFMRNVLIYFDAEAKRDVLARVRGVIRPDGYVFLGAAESPTQYDDEFERAPFARANCYRLSDPA